MHLLLFLVMTLNTAQTVFDFDKNSNPELWRVVDDVVMGGRSDGSFGIDDDGHGVFSGSVSTENNGGFSSVRYKMKRIKTSPNHQLKIKLKGDGKSYQVRIKHKSLDSYSYIASFDTTGDWQEIEVKLSEMYPSFRGRRLTYPNFDKEYFEEIVFLIGNKKNEDFRLLLDSIELE